MNLADRARPDRRNPWVWVPTLYMAEGIPYILVTTVSVILYKNLGISNTDIALYTSWLYLPWVIKPLWSPLVDMIRTKRLWIVLMQLLVGGALACIALTIPVFRFFSAIPWPSSGILPSARPPTNIAADGFYMLGLEQYQQAAFVGVSHDLLPDRRHRRKGHPRRLRRPPAIQRFQRDVRPGRSAFSLGAAITSWPSPFITPLSFLGLHRTRPLPVRTASPRAMADVLDIFRPTFS
jgi:PAT family beta-lactamase induction signal transducer AmpG